MVEKLLHKTQIHHSRIILNLQAEKMIVDLERGSEAVKKKFLGVLAYFGEDAGMSSTEFFTTLHKFVLVSLPTFGLLAL